MREKFASIVFAAVLLIGVSNGILLAFATPSSVNEYGYYNDTYDIQFKKDVPESLQRIYEPLKRLIEPVTEGKDVPWYLLLGQLVWFIGSILGFVEMAGLRGKQSPTVQWCSIIIALCIIAYHIPFYFMIELV